MKKIVLFVSLLVTINTINSAAQDSAQQNSLTQVLSTYYGVKDALVAGNSTNASLKASEFVKTIKEVDSKIISKENADALLKDATAISQTKDIKQQREYFSGFSDNMFKIAKTVKLTPDPIYQQYCPMKKTYWLSDSKSIKNPYYGSAMLTCGKVVETLQ
ncbi:MAG: DUF3347 domain-containing protein [Bacteroidota bacterium]